jgi:hypothetical protein
MPWKRRGSNSVTATGNHGQHCDLQAIASPECRILSRAANALSKQKLARPFSHIAVPAQPAD